MNTERELIVTPELLLAIGAEARQARAKLPPDKRADSIVQVTFYPSGNHDLAVSRCETVVSACRSFGQPETARVVERGSISGHMLVLMYHFKQEGQPIIIDVPLREESAP